MKKRNSPERLLVREDMIREELIGLDYSNPEPAKFKKEAEHMSVIENCKDIERNIRMATYAGEYSHWVDVAKAYLEGISPQSLTFAELAATVNLCSAAGMDSQPFMKQIQRLKKCSDSLEKLNAKRLSRSPLPFPDNYDAGILPMPPSEQVSLFQFLDAFFSRTETSAHFYQEELNIKEENWCGNTRAERFYDINYVEVRKTTWTFNYHDEDWNEYTVLRAEKITKEEFDQKSQGSGEKGFPEPFDCWRNSADCCFVYASEKLFWSDSRPYERWYGYHIAYIHGLEDLTGYYRFIYSRGND